MIMKLDGSAQNQAILGDIEIPSRHFVSFRHSPTSKPFIATFKIELFITALHRHRKMQVLAR